MGNGQADLARTRGRTFLLNEAEANWAFDPGLGKQSTLALHVQSLPWPKGPTQDGQRTSLDAKAAEALRHAAASGCGPARLMLLLGVVGSVHAPLLRIARIPKALST